MAYSVNWITKVITVPVSDLILVSGTRYQLSMANFLSECRRLEWDFTDGLWAQPIVDHTNAKLDFAGADYAGFDEVINGYSITFSSPATRVDLLGSNNNIIDVLNINGISIVPGNSAGLQTVTINSGSGLSEAQNTMLTISSMQQNELWRLKGCDINNPLIVTRTNMVSGDIDMTLSGDGTTTTTVQRN